MNKKERNVEFIKRNWIFLVVLFIISIWHIFMQVNLDSTWFSIQLNERTYSEYINWRYTGWSSRIFIETGLLFFTNHVVLWRIADVIIWMFIIYTIVKLVDNRYTTQLTGCVCFLFGCYNLSEMNTAGWIATINNYIWPLGCLCGILLILKKLFQEKSIKWYIGIFGVFLTIFACNHEQTAAAAFGIFVCYIAYMIWKKRKISRWIWGYFIATLASLAFILTCPGNEVRKTIEISAYFPEYQDLSVWNKLDIGFTSFFQYNIFEHNYLFLIFLIMLCVVIWKKKILYWKKCMALIPVIGTIGGGYLLGEFSRFLPGIEKVRSSLTKTGTYVENVNTYYFVLCSYCNRYLMAGDYYTAGKSNGWNSSVGDIGNRIWNQIYDVYSTFYLGIRQSNISLLADSACGSFFTFVEKIFE